VYRVGKGPYVIRVSSRDGRSIRASTGTTDEGTAKAVRTLIRDLRMQRRFDLIDAVVDKRITLRDLYDYHRLGKLEELVAELADADLDPLVSEWERSGANERYVFHVRRLIPEGSRFPASRFRRKTVSVFLAGLPVSGSTRNRHKASLSVFAKWLVEREVIDSNPVRDVKSAKPNPARMVWLSKKQARQLVAALPQPYRALEALMAGTGMEWSAIANTKREDVDEKERKILARGGKNRYRTRNVFVTESWAWNEFWPHLKTLHPNAPLFDLKHDVALLVHHEASKAVGLPKSTLHDWRHTYAVKALKDGVDRQFIKRQLGHAPNSTVVETVYGVYLPTEAAPKTVTSASRHLEKSVGHNG
jgi:integrase